MDLLASSIGPVPALSWVYDEMTNITSWSVNRCFFAFSGGAWIPQTRILCIKYADEVVEVVFGTARIHNFLVSFAPFLWSSQSELNMKRFQRELRNCSVVGFCNHVWPTPCFKYVVFLASTSFTCPTQAITAVSRCYISTRCSFSFSDVTSQPVVDFHFRHLKNLEHVVMGTKIT